MRWPSHNGKMPPGPVMAALWQAPLIGLLSLEIGAVLMAFWAGGLAVSLVTGVWRRWYAQLPLLVYLVGMAALAVPVKSADFFITLLVGVLPLTWHLEARDGDDGTGLDPGLDPGTGHGRTLSPAGLTPTIFLVGSVFLYQVQFAILLLVVVWLLAFLLWYCMALTGFRLDAIRLRWGPVLLLSTGVSALIVLLFIAVPRISTGFIPGFTAQQKVALTDHVAPGGMHDLLRDETIAFRAVPQQDEKPTPRYWRVFVLDQERDGEWRRAVIGPARTGLGAAPATHRYLLLLDDHDPATLPAPDWPRGFSQDYAYSRTGELLARRGVNPRRVIVGGASHPPDSAPGPVAPELSGANPRLAAWAAATRREMASDRAFAELLIDRFAREYSYDTTLDLPPKDALDSFFFDTRSGYCAYFATAMATALRAAGIEANIVMGYLGGAWNGYGGFWTIRNADAHAWVEARLDGGGWQRLDPTLGVRFDGGADGRLPVDRPLVETGISETAHPLLARLQQAGQWVEALNTRITIAVMNYGQDGDRGAGATRDRAALVFLALGLAMTGVIAVAALMALRRVRSRRSRLETRLERMLASDDVDGVRATGETLISYAVRRSRHLPEAQAGRVTALAAAITAFRFHPGPKPDAGRIGADLSALSREIWPRHGLGVGRVLFNMARLGRGRLGRARLGRTGLGRDGVRSGE